MNGVIGGLDQGVRLFQLRVLNLNDLFETIPKTQHQSLEHQTLIFYSISEHITFHQTSEQASNVMSPKTRAYNLPSVRSKPNKKVTNNKRHLFGRSLSIVETIKECTQNAKEMEMLKIEMTQDITKQILENEQVGRKLLLERQL
jgi:hypothetical protein